MFRFPLYLLTDRYILNQTLLLLEVKDTTQFLQTRIFIIETDF